MCARHGGEGAADFGAGGIAVGMKDAWVRMRRFASAHKATVLAIEARAPLDKFLHATRAFAHQKLGGVSVHKPIAGSDGVIEMQLDVFFAFHGNGDTALRVVGVGFANRLFRDHEYIAMRGQFKSCSKPRNACTHDEKVTTYFASH
jgi:hypothetical protein